MITCHTYFWFTLIRYFFFGSGFFGNGFFGSGFLVAGPEDVRK